MTFSKGHSVDRATSQLDLSPHDFHVQLLEKGFPNLKFPSSSAIVRLTDLLQLLPRAEMELLRMTLPQLIFSDFFSATGGVPTWKKPQVWIEPARIRFPFRKAPGKVLFLGGLAFFPDGPILGTDGLFCLR